VQNPKPRATRAGATAAAAGQQAPSPQPQGQQAPRQPQAPAAVFRATGFNSLGIACITEHHHSRLAGDGMPGRRM
jgi:hypothetical protein